MVARAVLKTHAARIDDPRLLARGHTVLGAELVELRALFVGQQGPKRSRSLVPAGAYRGTYILLNGLDRGAEGVVGRPIVLSK